MALKSTIFKAVLSLSDIDRGVYGDFPLTIARHPSETDERMMVRMLAFALHASQETTTRLEFGKGISNEDEPALWRRDLTGAVADWIEVGLPEAKVLRRACGRADRVWIYTYGGRAVDIWWRQNENELTQQEKLGVYDVPMDASRALAKFANRSMALNATIHESQILIGNADDSVSFELRVLKAQ